MRRRAGAVNSMQVRPAAKEINVSQPVDGHHSNFDLRALAGRAMRDAGFMPDVPPDVTREARLAAEAEPSLEAGPNGVRDLRSWLWSSIDNVESRDLDQIEFVQRAADDSLVVLLGIADVDAFAPKGSAVDEYAAHNTTSVYAGVATFPMLPDELSSDATSLLPGTDKLAVVMGLSIAPDGSVHLSEIGRALVRNHAKLDYESVGAWLEGDTDVPTSIASVPGLEEQLRLQDEAAQRLRALRQRKGALNFDTIEARPVTVNGRVVDLAVVSKNRARDLIESFMVAANSVVAEFLESKGSLSIQRVVRMPQRWDRIVEVAAELGEKLPSEPDGRALNEFLTRRKKADALHFPELSLAVVKLLGAGEYAVVKPGALPEGHFGLAAADYAHSTAPNRRYPDLVTQRLLKAAIAGAPSPYAEAELEAVVGRCTERESAARKVERLLRKAVAARLLSERIGQVFDAIVTGASEKGTWVRLLQPPAEGRVMRGEQGMDVGDRVRVRLVSTQPERGFIDFERAA